jgi:limonene-1,2-epoxide hydrolase
MTMKDPGEVVAAFIAAIEAKDVDAAIELLADDVSYENVPMSPIAGKEAVRATLGAFLGAAAQVEWPISRQVVAGNAVINERLDRFQIGNGWLELPVAGVFEVDEHGLITLWRDYFDMSSYTGQLAALTATD